MIFLKERRAADVRIDTLQAWGGLATAVKYALPIEIIVIKNNTLGMIKWEQMVFLGNPEYRCELQPIDFAAAARAFGATGLTVDDPAQCCAR